MDKTPLWHTRTFWAAVTAGVTAVGSFAAGEVSFGVLLQTLSTALIGVFLRDGIAKALPRL